MKSFADSIYTSFKEGRKEEAVAKAFLILSMDILITIFMAIATTNVTAVILTVIALVTMDISILLKIRNRYKEDNCIE